MEKSNDSISREEAIASLQVLQYDYADGKGDYGPVITEFTSVLNRYQSNYYQWGQGFSCVGNGYQRVSLKNKMIPMLKTALIIGIVFLILKYLFHMGWFIAILFYIISGVALTVIAENFAWSVMYISFGVVLHFVLGDNEIIYVAFFLILYAVMALKSGYEDYINKQRNEQAEKQQQLNRQAIDNAYKQLEINLHADWEKLITMEAALRAEYTQKRNELFSECPDCFTDDEKAVLCSDLPEVFWWNITIEQLDQIEKRIKKIETWDSSVSWESRWVNRTPQTAFDAGQEYTALFPIYENNAEISPKLYSQVKDNLTSNGSTGYILDFIARGTSSKMEAETVEFEDYAHSQAARDLADLGTLLTAHSIDKAYRDDLSKLGYNEELEQTYADVVGSFVVGSTLLDEKMNKKVTQTWTDYHQVKNHTNIWMGQVLMTEDDEPGGVMIMDYRCQIPHVLSCIDLLNTVKVTRVLGDPMYRNPIVMAKIHKICKDCR